VLRPIFFALLLANLLYMGWAEWIDVPEPPPPSSTAGLPRLKLVSDLPPDKRAALASKPLEKPAQECVSVGPFDDPAIAAKAAALLRSKSFAPLQRAAESPAIRRYWVYLQGFATDAGVTRVLHRLEKAGIDDAEAMPPEAGDRRISLGLFTQRDRAERRVKTVTAMGLRVSMTQRMLPGTVYWLDVTFPSGSTPVPLKDVSDLQPSGGSSPISVQPCASAPSPTAPSPQEKSPASPPVNPAAPALRATPQASAPASAATLPRCKPGGGGTVPCVVLHVVTQPSVL
jgi:hypothetical protein